MRKPARSLPRRMTFSGKPVAGRLPSGTNAALLMRLDGAGVCAAEGSSDQSRAESRRAKPRKRDLVLGRGEKTRADAVLRKDGDCMGAVISAVDLIQGIGRCAKMDVIKVEGATGTFETNFAGKAQAAIRALNWRRTTFMFISKRRTSAATTGRSRRRSIPLNRSIRRFSRRFGRIWKAAGRTTRFSCCRITRRRSKSERIPPNRCRLRYVSKRGIPPNENASLY